MSRGAGGDTGRGAGRGQGVGRGRGVRTVLGRTVLGLAALLSLPSLAACGIQKSDVVEAGGPAPVTVHPTGGIRMLLFFVDRDGRLMPVARDLRPDIGIGPDTEEGAQGIEPTTPPEVDYRVPSDKLLSALLEGPEDKERAAGLTTRLTPHGSYQVQVTPSKNAGTPVVLVRVATRVKDLDPVAVRQLVCTAAYAEDPTGAVPVGIRGLDGELAATGCRMD
ncbi:hypothetical protein ABZ135_08955 [Streptomyces sp. NPDC006339]|uniref:hypothetical protein n=1 Tax=Streptomyces sp. NPDC006339 TaxID=3156755 RepID=UPI0033BE0B00